jgi:hypothetical protein
MIYWPDGSRILTRRHIYGPQTGRSPQAQRCIASRQSSDMFARPWSLPRRERCGRQPACRAQESRRAQSLGDQNSNTTSLQPACTSTTDYNCWFTPPFEAPYARPNQQLPSRFIATLTLEILHRWRLLCLVGPERLEHVDGAAQGRQVVAALWISNARRTSTNKFLM